MLNQSRDAPQRVKCSDAESALCSECWADPWWEKNDLSEAEEVSLPADFFKNMMQKCTGTAGRSFFFF